MEVLIETIRKCVINQEKCSAGTITSYTCSLKFLQLLYSSKVTIDDVSPPLSDEEEQRKLVHNKRLKFLAKARRAKRKQKKCDSVG